MRDGPGSSHTVEGLTPRARAKAERRREILAAAARLMARSGFHAVRLDDLGAEVGISGPAMYRYFRAKEDVLAEMLLDISHRLVDGGTDVLERELAPAETMEALIGVHVDFVVHEPDLITVQFRDLGSLPAEPRHTVRSLQRQYVQIWVDTLRQLRPELEIGDARTHVHAVFGLLNSSPRLPDLPGPHLGEMLGRMARAALEA